MDNTEIRNLIDKLNYYTKLYDQGIPAIDDKSWDEMYFKLQKLENEKKVYFEDSPTQSINYQVVNNLKKVEHNHLMLSLDKTKSIEELKSFVGNKKYIAMSKLDGISCSLKYLNGKLISAETRGNGLIGEDILHNALVIKNIPNKINYNKELIIDGEIICTYKDFEPFKEEYKNPRNFTSGSARLLDSEECAKRNLSFVAWDIIKGFDQDTLEEKLISAETLGFTIVPMYFSTSNLENAIEQINLKSKALSYPIDGVVFKYNNVEEYNNAGRTEHHFRGGLAYKFYDETCETSLLDIKYEVSRLGQLTPVAVFEPINIEGTIVERCSLFNLSILKDKLNKPYKGQKIWISKRNKIIPYIEEAEKDNKETKNYIEIPNICTTCGEELVIENNEGVETLWCENKQCPALFVNRVEHFLGKKGLDAKGISKATIEKLVDWGWIKEIPDVFKLVQYEKEWKNKTGFGEKSVNNILKAIKDSCNTNLEAIISSAGIPLIGRTVARDLAKKFNNYNSFREAIKNNFDFTQFNGFGYEMDKSIKNFDYNELDKIVKDYLIEKELSNNNNNKMENLVFCITGKLKHWKTREELKEIIESFGGKVVSAMSSNVDYLINNDVTSTSAKNKKAKELNKEILNEENLIKKFDL